MIEKTNTNLVEKIEKLPLIPSLNTHQHYDIFDFEVHQTRLRYPINHPSSTIAYSAHIICSLYQVGAMLVNTGFAYQCGTPVVSDGRMITLVNNNLTRQERIQRYKLQKLYYALPQDLPSPTAFTYSQRAVFIIKIALEHMPAEFVSHLYTLIQREVRSIEGYTIALSDGTKALVHQVHTFVKEHIDSNEALFSRYVATSQSSPQEKLLGAFSESIEEGKKIMRMDLMKILPTITLPLLPKTQSTTSYLLSGLRSIISYRNTTASESKCELIPIFTEEAYGELFSQSLSKTNFLHATSQLLQVLYHVGSKLINSGRAYTTGLKAPVIGGQFVGLHHCLPPDDEQIHRREKIVALYHFIDPTIIGHTSSHVANPDLALFVITAALDHLKAEFIHKLYQLHQKTCQDNSRSKEAEATVLLPNGVSFFESEATHSILTLYIRTHDRRFSFLSSAELDEIAFGKRELIGIYGQEKEFAPALKNAIETLEKYRVEVTVVSPNDDLIPSASTLSR